MKALGNGEFCNRRGGVRGCDCGRCGGRQGRQRGGDRGGTRPYLQIQLHGLLGRHRQMGEGRVDFPQEPEGEDTCGEGEAVRAGQSPLPGQEPVGGLCLLPRRQAEHWAESLPGHVPGTAGGKPLVFPAGLQPTGVLRVLGELLSWSCPVPISLDGQCFG